MRISEIAERSSVPTSTLRYYERIGLVEPLGRADNGYRVYDEATLDRLALIGRAKRLGMNLDDVATLVDAWFAGDCEPVQDQLRTFVTGRIAELRRQIADETAFEGQMERILSRLGSGPPVTERCRPDCGCDIDPLETAVPAASPDIACSLAASDVEDRLEEWRRVVSRAERTERGQGGLRVVFAASPGVTGELARLCAAETVCCPFFTFALEITASAVVLGISGPADAEDMTDRFLDLITGSKPSSLGAAPVGGGGLASTRPLGAIGNIPAYAPAATVAPERGPVGSAQVLTR